MGGMCAVLWQLITAWSGMRRGLKTVYKLCPAPLMVMQGPCCIPMPHSSGLKTRGVSTQYSTQDSGRWSRVAVVVLGPMRNQRWPRGGLITLVRHLPRGCLQNTYQSQKPK